MRSYFKKIVQNFELKRVGGAPKSHLFAPLFTMDPPPHLTLESHAQQRCAAKLLDQYINNVE